MARNPDADGIFALTWAGAFGQNTGRMHVGADARALLSNTPSSRQKLVTMLPGQGANNPFAYGIGGYPGNLNFGPIFAIQLASVQTGQPVSNYMIPETPIPGHIGEPNFPSFGYGFDTGSPWLQLPAPVCASLSALPVSLDDVELRFLYQDLNAKADAARGILKDGVGMLQLPLQEWMRNPQTVNSPVPGAYQPTNQSYCVPEGGQGGVTVLGLNLMRWFDVVVDYKISKMTFLTKPPILTEAFGQ